MSPITLRMFVTNAGSTAGKPDDPTTQLNLNLTPKGDQVDDANLEVLPDVNRRSASLNAQGIDEKLLEGIRGGQRATVTIAFE